MIEPRRRGAPFWARWAALGCALALGCVTPEPARQAAPPKGWLAQVQRQLAAREYRASENGEGLQAPNRAHNLRTYFAPSGIRVHDRAASGSPELLRLSLRGVGRSGALTSAGKGGEVAHAGNRVEIQRPGLVEWYVNSEAGVEQGFTLETRPAGRGPLVVELAFAGAKPSLRGDVVVFETATRRRLTYGALAAIDAARRPVAARFALVGDDRLQIVVDDAGAKYPLVIDPLLTEAADAQVESDQASAFFGWSVASAGDVNDDGYTDVIIGARGYDAGQIDEGAAFVFLGSASGLGDGTSATAAARIESNQRHAHLGESVAAAGDVNGDGYGDVIVGAKDYDAHQPDEGAAFVFLGSASGIADGSPASAAARLESNQTRAQLGQVVAGAGDVNGDGYADVIAGAPGYDDGEKNEGAAFLFLGSAAGIASATPKTAAARITSDQPGALLPAAVASAGDVNGDAYADVIVGVSKYDAGQGAGEGAAFVFLGSASGLVGTSPAAAAQLESDQAGAAFGASASGAGDVNGDGYADVIVGSSSYDSGGADAGAVFLFHGSAAGIADGTPATAAAQLSSDQALAALGASVAGAGDVNGDGYADVIAGAPGYDAGQSDEGAAFVFLGSAAGVASGTVAGAFAQLETHQASAQLGASVAGAGDVNGDGYADVLAGARSHDAGQIDEGVAFVFHGGASGLEEGAIVSSDPRSAMLGSSVSSAGDVNGDGYSDVLIGAPDYDNGESREGVVYLFLGSATGIASGGPAVADARLESNQPGAGFGAEVSSAGDVNGDGYADVIIGAQFYDPVPSLGEGTGAAFVFLGSASGIASGGAASAHATFGFEQPLAALYGFSVSSAGDVNGDGYADVIVGAANYEGNGTASVFLGSASGMASAGLSSAHTRLESDQDFSLLGSSVAQAGDVNGDGFGDVVVGCSRCSDGQDGEGAALVFLGGARGIASGGLATAHARIQADYGNGFLGSSVSGAGDVNADGYADVIVGSHAATALLFLGSASGIASGGPQSADTRLVSTEQFNRFGESVSPAGDLNGDGYSDLLVGDVRNGVFVFLGSPSGIPSGDPANVAAVHLQPANARLGQSVSSAGDVNGDGYADLIAGSPSGTDAAFVFYGNGSGRPVLARQRRGDGSGVVVQPLGWSHSGDSLALEVAATHPEGRGKVKAEFELCPPGTPFGDVSCTSAVTSEWADVAAAHEGVTLSHEFHSLSAGLYRWRTRVLQASSTIDQPGISSPAHPRHGPWRRHVAQVGEGDIRTDVDSDGDQLFDSREALLGTDSTRADSDGDGLVDGDEVDRHRSDPLATDTDGDGLDDAVEVNVHHTNPLSADGDGDGLGDAEEVNVYATNPNSPDTDGDQLTDLFEVRAGFDPRARGETLQDPDGDGLLNLYEQSWGSDPTKADTDGDGYGDLEEIRISDPSDPGIRPVVLDLRPVYPANNPPHSTGFGTVPYDFAAALHEVTVRDYVSFLNAVADDDPHGLFNTTDDPRYGVVRTGSPGSYQYDVVPGRDDTPINFVSLYDAMRFVNWLQNATPPNSPGSIGFGSYPIYPDGIAANSITRFGISVNPIFVLPNENEWYKAAYYNPGSAAYYFEYPASSSVPMTCAAPADFVFHAANCGNVVGAPVEAGSYPSSASRFGLFDQGGNVWEWTDEISGLQRRIRGGGYESAPGELSATGSGQAIDPLTERADLGFRVARVPAPPLPE